MTFLSQITRHPETRRALRFLVVGVSGTLLDFLLLTVFKTGLGLPTLFANTLSYSAGIINNYLLNRAWTFSDATRPGSFWIQFGQFTTVSLIGLALNNGIVLLLEAPFGSLPGFAANGYLPAKLVATGLVLLWNFTANRRWTFKTLKR